MYLWTAPGNDRHASGVTDSPLAARRAAESLLRAGQAGDAHIECAYTAIGAPGLSFRYVRTGIGWSGRLGAGGQVVWTPLDPADGRPADTGLSGDGQHEGVGHGGYALPAPRQAEPVGGGGRQADLLGLH